MRFLPRIIFISALCMNSAFAITRTDKRAIHTIIEGSFRSWNNHAGLGYGSGYSESADFVNIFGMHFKGRDEIESRHVQILESFLRDSILDFTHIEYREAAPNVVITHIRWKTDNFRMPGADPQSPGEIRTGIFTHVFIKTDGTWVIESSHNTMDLVRR